MLKISEYKGLIAFCKIVYTHTKFER